MVSTDGLLASPPEVSNYANRIVDEFIPSQLIMISPNKIAQYWVPYGHISFYERINLDELIDNTFRGGGRQDEPGQGGVGDSGF